MAPDAPQLAPRLTAGPRTDRLPAIDVLRGAALLGILVMNIQSFSMPLAAYSTPSAWGDLQGLNFLVWALSHFLFEQKMMALFGLLFGAGILLATARADERPPGSPGPALLHYRRMAVLLGIGMLHAYFLWYGDILVGYALCGMLAFPLRKCRPWQLIVLGVLIVSVQNAVLYLNYGDYESERLLHIRTVLTSLDVSLSGSEQELAAYQGSYLDQLRHRVPEALTFQGYVFLGYTLWRSLGLMLLGMALLKTGVLGARARPWTYLTLVLIGTCAGMPLVHRSAMLGIADAWSDYARRAVLDYWGSLLVALAYIGLVMLLCQSRWSRWLSPLAAVGRIALSNYLFQTLVCTGLFYGLHLFGSVPRTTQILVVLAVWILELIVSNLWLRAFRFGPAEWLWRSLTYGRRQPMRAA